MWSALPAFCIPSCLQAFLLSFWSDELESSVQGVGPAQGVLPLSVPPFRLAHRACPSRVRIPCVLLLPLQQSLDDAQLM